MKKNCSKLTVAYFLKFSDLSQMCKNAFYLTLVRENVEILVDYSFLCDIVLQNFRSSTLDFNF